MEPVTYNLDMKKIENWHKICYDQPKDVIAYIPNANLTKDDLLAGTTSVGKIYNPAAAGYDVYFMDKKYPGIAHVTNKKDKNGKFVGLFPESELGWHNNGNWRHWRHIVESCIAFYCVRPGDNVVTSYLDSKQAYENLSQDLKDTAEQYEYWAEFNKENSIYAFDDKSLNAGLDELLQIFEGNLSSKRRSNNKIINPVRGSWKPLIVTHPRRSVPDWWPENKGKAIYTGHFGVMRKLRNKKTKEEYSLKQMKQLLDDLHSALFKKEYIYNHYWKTGDLIINDQFFSYHKRNTVKGDRLLYRLAFNYKFLKQQ